MHPKTSWISSASLLLGRASSRRARRGVSQAEAIVLTGAVALAGAAGFTTFGSSVKQSAICLGEKLSSGQASEACAGEAPARRTLLQQVGHPGSADSASAGASQPGELGAAKPAPATSTNPLAGQTLYVDPNSLAQQALKTKTPGSKDYTLIKKIADQPHGVWLTDGGSVQLIPDTLKAAGNKVPLFVAYNIPFRDASGAYSAGGAPDPATYKAWIDQVSKAIGNDRAVLVLEPDALADLMHLQSKQLQDQRLDMLKYATSVFKKNNPNLSVYLDAGNAHWLSADDAAKRLKQAGVDNTAGFSLNVSNYIATPETEAYGKQVSDKLGGKHFIVDTSRNGNGAPSDGAWCNPPGRALGGPPQIMGSGSVVDAHLWVKPPGESDGSCNGGPPAGQWYDSYALGLASGAH